MAGTPEIPTEPKPWLTIQDLQEIYRNFRQRGVPVVLRETTAVEGADGHYQVNNLRMVHQIIFNCLDQQFAHASENVWMIM